VSYGSQITQHEASVVEYPTDAAELRIFLLPVAVPERSVSAFVPRGRRRRQRRRYNTLKRPAS
jgi:hypothetical protein